jgi:hypothetical protein
MIKTFARLLLPLLMLATLLAPASAADTTVPPAFDKLVPRAFADGLRLVEVRQRLGDSPSWRSVEIVSDSPDGPARQEKVSVVDGITAMYAYPGSGYFANVKVEKSAPGSIERDKAILAEALEHVYARSRQGVTAWVKEHPADKEKFDRFTAGRDYMELERGKYKGVDYLVLTQNLSVANPAAMPAQLHIFLPRDGLIVTAYLMKQRTTMFKTLDEFRRSQRAFIEGYIDFVLAE